ncbi:MAG: hypothetical protein UHN02_00435 [Acutalibacteraceae bacterium]|nr:hypothetical protein [Acutalibacteraceae bacterium]
MFINKIFSLRKLEFFAFVSVAVILVCFVWNTYVDREQIYIKDNSKRVEYLLSRSLSVESEPVYKKEIAVNDEFIALCPSLKKYNGQRADVYCYESENNKKVLVFQKGNLLVGYYKYKPASA